MGILRRNSGIATAPVLVDASYAKANIRQYSKQTESSGAKRINSGNSKACGFVATRDPRRAKKFYRDTLGLALVSEDEFALVFDAAGTMLRVSRVQSDSSEIHSTGVAGP